MVSKVFCTPELEAKPPWTIQFCACTQPPPTSGGRLSHLSPPLPCQSHGLLKQTLLPVPRKYSDRLGGMCTHGRLSAWPPAARVIHQHLF